MVVGTRKVVCRGSKLEETPESSRADPKVVTIKALELPSSTAIISPGIDEVIGADEYPLGRAAIRPSKSSQEVVGSAEAESLYILEPV